MENRLKVLKLVLDEIGQEFSIDNLTDRKRLQKSIYLTQAAEAIDLGYRYSWYLKGPYSTKLTHDYYKLHEHLFRDRNSLQGARLREGIVQNLDKVKSLHQNPIRDELEESEWLELLASWHYLRTVSKYDQTRARDEMAKSKQNLVDYIPRADDTLKQHNLLDA